MYRNHIVLVVKKSRDSGLTFTVQSLYRMGTLCGFNPTCFPPILILSPSELLIKNYEKTLYKTTKACREEGIQFSIISESSVKLYVTWNYTYIIFEHIQFWVNLK